LYAIFWEKYQTWTLNSVENFEPKTKKHKIKLFDAFKNDLSIIVGDITFVISQPIYRKTICDKNITDSTKAQHEKFGVIISDSVSVDNINYVEIDAIESAIIDSTIKMKIIDTEEDVNETTIIEISDSNYFLKLSTLILRYSAVFGIELNEQYADFSRITIIEFFKKLNIIKSYQIPNIKTKTSDFLYKQAFDDSWVIKNYGNM
jgi:hypothetical protein